VPDFVPAAVTGVWKREVLTAPGRRDETTRVFWLQTRSWYGDIRIKADRPHRDASGFADYDDAALVQLAASQGFCGQLSVTGDTCFWRRDLDFQPPSDDRDEAKFQLEGDSLIEDGMHADYQEIWRRQTQSLTPLTAFKLTEDTAAPGRGGLLVVAGDHFIEIQGRPEPLAPAASLSKVVEAALAAGKRAEAIEALSCRISYGHREAGRWTVALSTWPWREGASLFAGETVTYDSGRGALVRKAPDARQTWTVLDATADGLALKFG